MVQLTLLRPKKSAYHFYHVIEEDSFFYSRKVTTHNLDNTELYQTKLAKKKTNTSESKPTLEEIEIIPATKETPKNKELLLREAFDYSLELKEKIVNERTLKDYTYSTNGIIKWIEENRPEITTITQLSRKVSMDFLNNILLKTSSRNRNNNRLNLSSLLQTLVDNEIILSNPMSKIKALKTVPKRNKSYKNETEKDIFKYLKTEDPILLLYIQFVSYAFLRPIEVCKLKVKDFDFVNNTFKFKAKNKPSKTKIIPKILLDAMPDLSKHDPESWLFTPEKIGGEWDTTENNKRDYFSKRFKNGVKKDFNLSLAQTACPPVLLNLSVNNLPVFRFLKYMV